MRTDTIVPRGIILSYILHTDFSHISVVVNGIASTVGSCDHAVHLEQRGFLRKGLMGKGRVFHLMDHPDDSAKKMVILFD